MAFLDAFLITVLLSAINCDTNYRLNTRVIPSEYTITVTPYFDTFTFDGEVSIKVTTPDSYINQIKIHSEDLEFSPQNITIRNGNIIVPLHNETPLEFNATYKFAYINLATDLIANLEYVLNIAYTGPIRNDMNGFYRSYYVENGQTKWLAATQMEPVHARKVFPSFDEPGLKAIFNLIIDRPENYAPTLTNTKLQETTILNNGYIRERFFPTPVMSTYLVAILVSEFSNGGHMDTGDREFGVWVRPEATNQSEYAFNFGKRVVEELGNYLGIDYYSVDSNLNLNHVGLPDFRAGAMENWGLIKYREALVMYDPSESTPYYKYRVAQIVAHETTHMWFGNLVTCHWWSDTWLNEGFANYFQDYITSLVDPQLGSADLLVTSSVHTAYTTDETETPSALTNNDINSPDEISGHFDAISYQKGGSIIRMIHHWIGDEAFKSGLNQHLNVGRLNVVTPSMLYIGLDTGVSFTNSLAAYPGYTVAGLMSAWVSQSGHPVLKVEFNHTSGEIILTQNRFYASSNHQSNELYPIPITYTTQSEANFDDTKPAFIMADRTHSFGNFSHDDWIIFNLQETGFYRVNYDDHLWSLIGEVLRGPNRTTIHYLNRAKIVNDIFALAAAEQISFQRAFDVLEFLSEETDYSVWIPALSGFNTLRNLLSVSGADQVEVFALRLLENVIQDLGFDERANDNFVTLRNRMQITEFACKLGHEACVEHAVSTFRAFRDNGTPVPPSLRPVVYCQGLKHGTPEDYDFMYQRKLTTNVANEALVIEAALSCTVHEEKLHSYLEQMVTSDSQLRTQDITMPLSSVLSDPDNFQIAFGFLKQYYAALRNKEISMSTILSYFPSTAIRTSDFTEFESWLETCTVCETDEVEAAQKAIQSAKTRRDWTQAHLGEIVDPLRQKNDARSLIPSIAALVFTVVLVKVIC